MFLISDQTLDIPFKEKLKNLPGIFGIRQEEEAYYEVLHKENNKEIRRYSPMALVRTTTMASYQTANEKNFRRLASYIFNENPRILSMTSPVFHEKSDLGWTMSFILPAGFNLKNAPSPRDPSVSLYETPPRNMAALKYHGLNDRLKIADKTFELERWLTKKSAYQMTSTVISAHYNSPGTLPFIRKNEVLIGINLNN